MIRDFLSSTVQKKFFLMFFTSLIYILGLCAYFSGHALVMAFLVMVFGIFAILKNYLSPKLVLFWYFMFFFAFFNASLRIKNTDVLYQIAPQNAIIYGQIVSIPNSSVSDKTKFFFDVSKVSYGEKTENIKAKTLVSVESYKNDFSKLNIGNYYEIKGKLRTPFEVTNPSQFDYGKYLRNFDVFSIFYAEDKDCLIQKNKLTLRWQFLQGLNNIRNDILCTHAKYLKSPNLEILGGVVFGDDAVSPPDYIKKSFANSGLLHILAASGMNVALIYGIWFFILRRLRVPFNITVSSGIFVIIFYALMTGLGPSVIRAMFMLIFILVGKLMDRDAHSISLLSFVALLMLIYNPAYINDVGFQLSFLVTFGLLIMAPIVLEKSNRVQKTTETILTSHVSCLTNLPQWLVGAIFIPIIAQIWVAPIQMYYFNSFSLYSVFANIVILPFVTVISFGGFVSAVLSLIKPFASTVCLLFDFILSPVLSGLIAISGWFSSLPHSLIQTPKLTLVQIFLYYSIVLLITLLIKIGQNKKLIIIISILLLSLILSCIKIPNYNFETIFFDVQNADAFLVKTPQGKYFIIDSGKMAYKGGKTQAKAIILEYLKDKGIKNIEGFIITHFDSDHAGGAVDLIENLNIKTVYVNSVNDKSNLAKKIYISAKGKIKQAKNNEIIYKDENFVIKTFEAGLKGQGDEFENENSVITLISDKDFDELFMADAGIEGFDKIRNYLPQKVEILKVGHHGAKNVVDKSMLDRISPNVAIISTGINNYGHPNGITLDILERHKVKTLRTDRQNALKIIEKANKYKVFSYDKNEGFVTIN